MGGEFTSESSHSPRYLNTEERQRENGGRDPSLSLEALLLPDMSRRISTGELQTLHYSQRQQEEHGDSLLLNTLKDT